MLNVSIKDTPKNKNVLSKYNKILIEYDEKRGNFNPTDQSPNIFVNKLEQRMAKYYSLLYSSANSKTK
tara:strand:- start:1836 stop:2039 length:204 start_codon:yes stop_codon:yes gene_type:complete